MGCVNSKKDLQDIYTSSSNGYRVYAVRISQVYGTLQHGYLELTPKDLTFSPEIGETIKWSLQHLRRYGCTSDVFSFEAGRRCMSGPGIYTFRCQNAESMYNLFQTYINSAGSNENSIAGAGEFPSLDPAYPNELYLEPNSANSSILYNRTNVQEDSAQSSAHSSNLNSPSSFQGVNFTSEVVHLSTHSNKRAPQNSNVYQEFPMKSNEFNNNVSSKSKSLDVPPQELAPIVQNVDNNSLRQRRILINNDSEPHMYENVATGERFYENFTSIDLPIWQNNKVKTLPNESGPVVNYITLDLQSPTSMDSFSLKIKPNGTDASASLNSSSTASAMKDITDMGTPSKSLDAAIGCTNTSAKPINELPSNSMPITNESQSMGYSTIDFIKTCALIKTTSSCDTEGSRITRHSTCIHKKKKSISD